MTWPAKFGEWTTPAEGLPTQGSRVILTLRNGLVAGGYYAGIYGKSGPVFWDDPNSGGWLIPIAWMPMPAPMPTLPSDPQLGQQ